MSTADELNELTKDEIRDQYPEVGFGANDTKDEMIEMVIAASEDEDEAEESSIDDFNADNYWYEGYDVRFLKEAGEEHPDFHLVAEWEQEYEREL